MEQTATNPAKTKEQRALKKRQTAGVTRAVLRRIKTKAVPRQLKGLLVRKRNHARQFFTEATQQRNIEAGVLVRYSPFVECLAGYFVKDFIRVVTANQVALISTSFSPKLRRSIALGSVFVRTSFKRALEVFPQVTQIT